jgi:glycosyltransferase involved in cell wall biosynthesis
MNILVIPTNDWTRAAGAGHINYIAEELAQRGHKVYAWNFDLYRNQPPKREPKKVKLVSSKALPLRDPAVFFTLNALVQSPAVFAAIRRLRIDVVINENVLCGLVAFLAAGRTTLKVFDFSDYFPESASVYYTGSSDVAKKLVEGVTLAVTKLNIKASDMCLAVCQSLIQAAAKIDRAKPCYLLTNGVNTNIPQDDSPQNAPEDKTLVVMGVIDDWLDFETPLQALSILADKFPTLNLVIIGPWQKQTFRDQFEARVQALNLASKVKVTGYISAQQLKRQLQEACCCIMPYRLDRFFSVIRLPEKFFVYSAYGKPVLSTPLPEVAALGCEHVFLYRNATEFVTKLTNILSQKTMRATLEAKAREFAKDHDFSVLAAQLEDLLVGGLAELRVTSS